MTPTETEVLKMFDENQMKWLSPDPLEPKYMIPDMGAIKSFLLTQLRAARAKAYEDGKNAAVDYLEENAPEAADPYPLHDAQVVDSKLLESAREA